MIEYYDIYFEILWQLFCLLFHKLPRGLFMFDMYAKVSMQLLANKTGSLLKSLFVKAILSLQRWIVLDDRICNIPGCPHLQRLTFSIITFSILDISRFVQCALCFWIHVWTYLLCVAVGTLCSLVECAERRDRICNSAGPSYLQRLTQGEAYHAARGVLAAAFKLEKPPLIKLSIFTSTSHCLSKWSLSQRWRQ